MALPAAAAEQHSIAILQPVNVSGNTNLDHWRYLIGFMLDYQIGEVRKLRVIPESSIAYGMRELGITKGKALTSAQARSLGEAIEATRVVRLDYGTKDGKCRLTARMINVATGSESSEIAAEAADWFHADLKITKVILDQLNIKPTRDERNKLERPVAKSPEVYDLLGRAYAYNQEHAPIRIWKECLEQAQLKEPNCSEVLYFLAHTAVVEDKLKDAQEFAKAAIKAAPDNAGSHFLLAQIYGLTEQNAAEARDEMLAARVLDPNDATYVTGWAAMLERQEKYDEAITFYEKAEKLAPCDFRTHVNFFSCLVSNHKPDRARHELELAEKYCDEEDPFADEAMIEAYACLGNVRKVLYHIEHYLKNAKKSEMPNERIVAMEEAANTIRKDLKPTYLEVPEPPQMTPEELAKSLMARLTEDEYSLVTDPLAGGSAIVGWAKQLAQDAKDQRDKAVRIFDALTGRLEFIEAAGRRTAQQTMRDWRDTNTVFTCQEYTFLYIALARACGLRANYALVDKDVEGNFVFHACAAVFLDGKAHRKSGPGRSALSNIRSQAPRFQSARRPAGHGDLYVAARRYIA